MRAGFAISVVGHVAALLLGLLYAGANPFDPAPADAITVDIVTPDEMAQAAAEAPAPETAPDTFGLSAQAAPFNLLPPNAPPLAAQETPKPPPEQTPPQASPPAQRPDPPRNVRQAAVAPPSEPTHPPPEPPQPPLMQSPAPDAELGEHGFANVFGMPIMLPGGRLGGEFDAPAYDSANIGSEDRVAFRDHLKTCSKLPAALSPADRIRIVLRVSLKPDGTLAAAPFLIEASASAKGPMLMASAINALRKCQPYTMLPADKYKEWKVLDLSFTPQDMAGG